MNRTFSLLWLLTILFTFFGCKIPSEPIPTEPDVFVDVQVTFDLDGGLWKSNIFSTEEPEHVLTITALNNTTGTALTLINTKDVSLRWFYKMFIVYNPSYEAYEVVGKDAADNSVSNLNLPDYDYIIAIHDNLVDQATKDIMFSYVENTDERLFLLFDQELNTYESGNLEMSVYPEDHINFNYTETLNLSSVLPTPVRDEFIFNGWSDGVNIYSVFPRYLESKGISNITYHAVWEGYTVEALEDYLIEFIPLVATTDLELPTTYSNYQISWSSDHENIISPAGQFTKPYQQTVVTLTATITTEEETFNKIYEIQVDGYKELTTGIASSYIYRNYHLLNDEFFETLDIINTAFITATDDASLIGTTYLANVETYIMPRAKIHGNWVIMSVAPESSWSVIAASPTLVNTFADHIVEAINTYGFDGVDIDWETPRSGEEARFTELMRVVSMKVKANNPNHLVTAAIAGGMWQPPMYDLINSQQYMDYINMMTYGMTSSSGYYQNALFRDTTNHHPTFGVGRTLTSCSIEESVAIYHDTYSIPYSKIIVGVAFYGMKQIRSFNSTTQTWSSWTGDGSVYYAYIVNNYLSNSTYTRYYDASAGVPYIVKNDGTEFVSYDDPRSIEDKSAYILDMELGGMMYWENGTDTTGTLLSAMRLGLNK